MTGGRRLGWKARRRWSLAILLIGLPVYIFAALWAVAQIERPSLWVELAIYVALGLVWALPFRFVFRGVGRADPDGPADEG